MGALSPLLSKGVHYFLSFAQAWVNQKIIVATDDNDVLELWCDSLNLFL